MKPKRLVAYLNERVLEAFDTATSGMLPSEQDARAALREKFAKAADERMRQVAQTWAIEQTEIAEALRTKLVSLIAEHTDYDTAKLTEPLTVGENGFAYGYSYDGGETYHGGYSGTRDEAFAEACDEIESLTGDHQYARWDPNTTVEVIIAEAIPFDPVAHVRRWGTYVLIEQLQEDAGNECGECAEDFLRHVSEEDRTALGERLGEVVHAWLIATKRTPHFWQARDVEKRTYVAKGASDDDE